MDAPQKFYCFDFPHIKQVFKLKREVTRTDRGKTKRTREIVYGVTSLTKEQVRPKSLLEFVRNHWGIENRVHYVRDVTYDEDRCRIRTQNGPRVMATIRNLAISIARMMKKYKYMPDATRDFTFCSSRKDVFALWGIW